MRVPSCTIAVLLVILVITTAVAAESMPDRCHMGGELRRNYNCASVRQTMKGACCYIRRDGVRGELPDGCCMASWVENKCESQIDKVCET